MSSSIDQWINEAVASGLIPAADLLAWLEALPPAARPKSGNELARELVAQGKLTRFQAEQIHAGQGKSLALGNYLILDKLGQGGMGLVLKAMHRRMERVVALKVMSQAGMKSPDAVQRFHREVKAAAKLNHPNIVTAYDADEANGTHFLVMEYVEGTDLSALVKKQGPLPVEHAVPYILQAARGLEYAHSRGVIHRDIKPSNLLLSQGNDMSAPGPVIKILDMGLARIDEGANSQAELTTTGAVMGTVDYMAPEQALSARSADARSDIYSLGITLWYLLTGRIAYEGDSVMARLLAHRDVAIPSLADEFRKANRPAGTPPFSGASGTESNITPIGGSRGLDPPGEALDAVFRRMVAKRVEDRYQSMSEVIRDLERFLSGTAPFAASHPGRTPSVADTEKMPLHIPSPPLTGGRSDLSANGTMADPWGASLPASRAAAETIILPVEGSSTGPGTNPSLAVNRGGSQRPKTKAVLRATIDTAFLIIFAIAFSMKGSLLSPRSGDVPGDSSGNNHHGSIAEGDGEVAPDTVVRGGGLRFDGQGDSVLLPELTSRDQPLTVEAWLTLASDRDMSVVTIPHADGAGLFRITVLSRGPQAVLVRNKSMAVAYSRSRTLPIGETFHLAMIFPGDGRWSFWLNGELLSTGADHYGWFPPVNRAFPAIVGMDAGLPLSDGQSRSAFHGTLRELRISQTARYSTRFQPAERLEPDKDTLALYHCDEGGGDILRDSSGNNHHGKVIGAKWVQADRSPIIAPLATNPAPPRAVAPFDAGQARAHQEAWAKHLGTTVETTNSVGGKMVLIPPGEFLMGSTDEQIAVAIREVQSDTADQTTMDLIQRTERPQHRVVITKPFFMGATEVTLGQFKKFVAATGHQTYGETQTNDPSGRTYLRPGYPVTDDSPVSLVTWDEAVKYCNWLSELEQTAYRLPTEAEWEYACRAGTETLRSWGDSPTQSIRYAWTIRNSEMRPHPVATRLPNPFGLFDLHGNVSEWCEDRFDELWYAKSPTEDPVGSNPGAHTQSVRGGNWDHHSIVRSAGRTGSTHHVHDYTLGFRVVQEWNESAATHEVTPAQGRATAPAHEPADSQPPRAQAPFSPAQARRYQESWAKHLSTTVETTNSLDRSDTSHGHE